MLTIGEFSKLCRVSTKTLRHYDKIHLIEPSFTNEENGYRYYEIQQLKDMQLIQRLKAYEFSLPEIAVILAERNYEKLQGKLALKKEALMNTLEYYDYLLHRIDDDIDKLKRSVDILAANFDIKTVETQDVKVYGIRKNMGVDGFCDAWDELFGKLFRNGGKPAGNCMAIYYDEDFNPQNSDIEVCIPIEEHIEGARVLKGHFCCTTEYTGPYETSEFTRVYTALTEWIENNGYIVAGAPIEKYVVSEQHKVKPTEYVTEFYFPIKKK